MTKVKMKTRTIVVTEIECLIVQEAIKEYLIRVSNRGMKGGYEGEEEDRNLKKLVILTVFTDKLDETFGKTRKPMIGLMKVMADSVRGSMVEMAEAPGGNGENN